MDLSALITRLQTVGSLAQVIEAKTGGFQTPVDSSTELYSLLDSLVSGGIHPVTLRDKATHPSIVYQLVSSQVGVVEGYQVTQTDQFVLFVRTEGFDALVGLVGTINSALAGSSYAIEIDDMLFDYDDVQKTYRANIQISFTYLSAASQNLPAAFVYAVDRVADDNLFDNLVRQPIVTQYGIVLVTDASNMPAITDDLMAVLLGWQRTATTDAFEYSGGRNLEGVAGLDVWRETYRDVEYVQQT